MRAMTFDEAPVQHRDDGGAIGRAVVHDYFGRGQQVDAGPQAYLGRQLDEGSEIYAHFHDVDQFQIVVMGGGRFGRTPVAPVTVQYADAFSPYGPIVANDGGLGFFVFRRGAATGGWRMPEFAHLIPRKGGRRFFVNLTDVDRRPAADAVECEALWGPEADGLEVSVLRLGAGAAATFEARGCGAQYLLVCAGALAHHDKTLPANSVLLQEVGEPAEPVVAHSEGAVVLVLKFPAPSDRPGSDPAKVEVRDGGYLRAVDKR